MAFPTTINSGTAAPKGHNPPHLMGSSVYTVQRSSSSGFLMYKATDPTSSFSSVGGAERAPGYAIDGISSYNDGTYIHIVTWAGTIISYDYHKFDPATDTWVTWNDTLSSASTGSLYPWASITARSTGEVVIVHAGATSAVMGGAKQRVYYSRKPSGGSWTSNVLLTNNDDNHYINPVCVLGDSNDIHIWLQYDDSSVEPPVDMVGMYLRTLRADNTLSTAISYVMLTRRDGDWGQAQNMTYVPSDPLESGAIRVGHCVPRYTSEGANTFGVHTYSTALDGSGDVSSVVNRGNADVTEVYPYANSATVITCSVYDSLGYMHVFGIGGGLNGGNRDVFYVKRLGIASFGTAETLHAVTGSRLSVARYTRGADQVAGYIWADSSNVNRYAEKVLISGGTTFSAASVAIAGQSFSITTPVTPISTGSVGVQGNTFAIAYTPWLDPTLWRTYPALHSTTSTAGGSDYAGIRPVDNVAYSNGRLYAISAEYASNALWMHLRSCVSTDAGSEAPTSWDNYTLPGNYFNTISCFSVDRSTLHYLYCTEPVANEIRVGYYRYSLSGGATPTVDVSDEQVGYDGTGIALDVLGSAHIYPIPNGECAVIYRLYTTVMGADYAKDRIKIRRTNGTWWEPDLGALYTSGNAYLSKALAYTGDLVYWHLLEDTINPVTVTLNTNTETFSTDMAPGWGYLDVRDDSAITNSQITSQARATSYTHWSSSVDKVLYPRAILESKVYDLSSGHASTPDFTRTEVKSPDTGFDTIPYGNGRHIVVEGKYIIWAYINDDARTLLKHTRGTVDNTGWSATTAMTASSGNYSTASIGWYRKGDYLYETITVGHPAGSTKYLRFYDRMIEGPRFAYLGKSTITVTGQTFTPITHLTIDVGAGVVALSGQAFDIVGSASETTVMGFSSVLLEMQTFATNFNAPVPVFLDLAVTQNGVAETYYFSDIRYQQLGVMSYSHYTDLRYSAFVYTDIATYIDDVYVEKTFPRTLGQPNTKWYEIVTVFQVTQTKDIDTRMAVSTQHSIVYGDRAYAYNALGSAIAGMVVGYTEVDSGVSTTDPVHNFTTIESSMVVTSSTEIDSAVRAYVASFTDIASGFSEAVHNFYNVDSGILAANPVYGSCTVDSSLRADPSVTAMSATVTVQYGSELVDPVSCSIGLSEGDAYWSCTMMVDAEQVGARPQNHDTFTVTIGSDVYSFVVTAYRSSERLGGNVLYEITGDGPQVARSFPAATPVTQKWEYATTAKTIVQELIGPVTWSIVDWVIPAYRVAADGAEPHALAEDIVSAAGGVIHPEIDGSTTIRYLHPVAATKMFGAEEFEFVTQDNIWAIEEMDNVGDYFDSVRVVDTETGEFADTMEYDNETKILTAYPSPWDATAYVTTTRNDVQLFRQSSLRESHTELVEFFAGEGSTRYPIFSIDGVEWVSLSFGGGLAFDRESNILSTVGNQNFYGLANITYTSRVVKYKVSATDVDISQFILNRE